VATREGWLYLAVILDLFSRKVVGWKLGEALEAELVVTALQNALSRREPPRGLSFHSDSRLPIQQRGGQETADAAGGSPEHERSG
jgi:putative transposase